MDEYQIARQKVIPYIINTLQWPENLVSNYGRVPVQMGVDTKWADLVCYISQGWSFVPWIVFEVKQPSVGVEQAIPQAESYSLILGAPFFCVTDGIDYKYYFTGKSQGKSIALQNMPPIPNDIYINVGLDNTPFPSNIDNLIDLFIVGLKSEKNFYEDTLFHHNSTIGLYNNIFMQLNNILPQNVKDCLDKYAMLKTPNRLQIYNEIDNNFTKIKSLLEFIKHFDIDPVLGIQVLMNDDKYKIKGGGIFFITQLLAGAHPDEYIVLEENISKSLLHLGIIDIVVKNDTANGYIYINDICKKLYDNKIKKKLQSEGFDIGLASVHNFLWHYYVHYLKTKRWY